MDFKNGTITVNKENINVDSIPWVPHHIFEGVYMKDLITGEKTEGKISNVIKLKNYRKKETGNTKSIYF